MDDTKESFPFDCSPELLRNFVDVHSDFTEAPDEFMAVSALCVAGAIAGPWVRFNKQMFNIYGLLVGPTSKIRKTTAQDRGMELLSSIKKVHAGLEYMPAPPADGKDPSPISGPTNAFPLATHFSVEGLQARSIGHGTGAMINMGEYGSLFSIGKRQSQGNTISELTNLFDGKVISVQTVSRSLFAENYSLSILAASTPDWLKEFCSDQNVGGGFVNRHLVAVGKRKPANPIPSEVDPIKWECLVRAFSGLVPDDLCSSLQGDRVVWTATSRKFVWADKSMPIWKEWYCRRYAEIEKMPDSLAMLAGREHAYAAKLAGLSAFMEFRNAVEPKDLIFGIRLARWCTRNCIDLVVPSGYQPESKGEAIIITKLQRSGPMLKRELQGLIGGRGPDFQFEKLLTILMAKGIIDERPDGLLGLSSESSNKHQKEIQKYFGKSDVYEICRMLDVGDTPSVTAETAE